MPYPNIVPTEYFTSSHSQVGCNKFSFWVTPHSPLIKVLGGGGMGGGGMEEEPFRQKGYSTLPPIAHTMNKKCITSPACTTTWL